mmetsp:Transcript_24660/g.38345  ORF Transcript_24660/g.38345 Transcript_24660/m.38345 type:complete len:212 (-) Transcript_24660:41-676(-)
MHRRVVNTVLTCSFLELLFQLALASVFCYFYSLSSLSQEQRAAEPSRDILHGRRLRRPSTHSRYIDAPRRHAHILGSEDLRHLLNAASVPGARRLRTLRSIGVLMPQHLLGLADFNLTALFDDSVEGVDEAALVVAIPQIDNVSVKALSLKLGPNFLLALINAYSEVVHSLLKPRRIEIKVDPVQLPDIANVSDVIIVLDLRLFVLLLFFR